MKSKKSKKIKKTKLNLFQKVNFKHKSLETVVLVFICAVVFLISSFSSGKFLYNCSQKKESALSSRPEMQIVRSAIAAVSRSNENIAGAQDSTLAKENNDTGEMFIEVSLAVANLSKERADKEAIARRIVRQRTAEIALINSAPILAGPTDKLSDGKRVCPLKHPQPSGRGGKPHIDEDCCADYDEYPNPRCEYSPEQMAALKKP
jgi:hypothetical protein